MHTRQEQLQAFDRLLTIMDELREQCPWDRKQTFESLRQNTIEEAYELASAIVVGDKQEISKELGDVLLHVIFYAKIGSETGDFDIADVCDHLADKLIFRHPHIYGEQKAANAEEVSKLWEQVKLKEKGGNKTILSGIPQALPALIKAYRIQDKIANAGLDTTTQEQAWAELKERLADFQRNPQEDDLGRILFLMVHLSRMNKIKPDNALEKQNLDYIERYDTNERVE
ncbi:MAG: nucleoside triphosphate pyrophosphohydrolase [Paludibacteraceae bacterium]|nr:nucleoside triphosphate pyrophosphohydrolase [Paludibacteraceae bacterium]